MIVNNGGFLALVTDNENYFDTRFYGFCWLCDG